jgi:hypothetical protein
MSVFRATGKRTQEKVLVENVFGRAKLEKETLGKQFDGKIPKGTRIKNITRSNFRLSATETSYIMGNYNNKVRGKREGHSSIKQRQTLARIFHAD